MRILLDTHIFLWAISDDRRLTRKRRELYADAANELYLSVASVWEVVVKVGLGRLELPGPAVEFLMRQLEANRVHLLGIHAAHLAELERLAPLHRDPFDRMIVAQAKAERMRLMSADSAMRQYKLPLV